MCQARGLHLPVIYNTGGYESEETLGMLDGWVDVYLPDFKYWESEQALRYSKAEDYPETVKKAIREMYRQTGACRFDENGKIQKGVIVRHLLLPGELKAAKRIVQYLYETYGDSVYMSLMNQYTPLDTLDTVRYPELGRKLTSQEYDEVVDYAIELWRRKTDLSRTGRQRKRALYRSLILLGCEVILLLAIKATLLCYHRLLCRRICRKCLSRIHCLGSGIRSDCVSSTRIWCCICGSLSR